MSVDEETSAIRLLVLELGLNVAGEGPGSVTGSPHEHAHGDIDNLAVGTLYCHALLVDVLDHMLGQDLDLVFYKRINEEQRPLVSLVAALLVRRRHESHL